MSILLVNHTQYSGNRYDKYLVGLQDVINDGL